MGKLTNQRITAEVEYHNGSRYKTGGYTIPLVFLSKKLKSQMFNNLQTGLVGARWGVQIVQEENEIEE